MAVPELPEPRQGFGDLGAAGLAVPGGEVHDQVLEAHPDVALAAREQVVDVPREGELERAADLRRVAADRVAVRVENAGEASRFLGLDLEAVPDVGVLGDHSQRLALTGAADPDGRVRLLHRLWGCGCVVR